MVKWSEERINEIVDQTGQGGLLVDIFNDEFYINITLDSKCGNNPKSPWVSSRFDYIHCRFTLRDFEECEDKEGVIDTFKDIVRDEVKRNLI